MSGSLGENYIAIVFINDVGTVSGSLGEHDIVYIIVYIAMNLPHKYILKCGVVVGWLLLYLCHLSAAASLSNILSIINPG